MSSPPETLVDCFWRRVAADPDRPAIFTFTSGKTVSRTWQQIADDAVNAAAQLHARQIQPGDRVAQLAENRYEWLIADLAILLSGAIHVPLHAQLPAAAAMRQIRDSGAKLLIISGKAQWQKMAEELERENLPVLSHETCESNAEAAGEVRALPDVLISAIEPQALATTMQRLQDLRHAILPEDPATLLYTSGTTGEPRGVLLSQRNLYLNAAAVIEAFLPRHHDRRLNFLPLSHIFARTCDWYVAIVSGTEIGLATSRETILADCQKFQPTVLNGVPYFFDKVRRTLLEQASDPPAAALQQMLGGKVSLCNVGGAALSQPLFDFYQSRGVPLRQGYGLTESSPVITLSTEDRFKPGSVGTAIPGVEVRVADDGEILARSPHVMLGYWQDEVATKGALRYGWLHTGDLGTIDAEGYVSITGRRKEMIVLASGKKIHPGQVEALLTAEPLILQALVVGEGRNYLTAILVPNPDLLRQLIRQHWLWVFSKRQALSHRRVRQWFAEALERALAKLAPWEQVKKFTLLQRGFTPESGELTAKLSLRREVIEQNLRAEIQAMYE